MRRIALLVAVSVLSISCSEQPNGHGRLGAAGPPPAGARVIPIGYDPSVTGLRGAVGEIVYANGGGAAWVKTGTSDTAWSTFPQAGGGGGGSSGTTYTAGTGIAIDGGVIANSAPFGSPISLKQANDAGTLVTTMTYTNTFTNKTPGSETSGNVFTALLNGSSVDEDISILNGVAPQLVTTSGAQPSIAWTPRADVLDITVGATTLTKLTVTGTSIAKDRCYRITWTTPATGEAASITDQSFVRLNNETNGVSADYTFQRSGAASAMALSAAWVMTDAMDTSSVGMSLAEFSAAAGGLVRGSIWMSILQGTLRYEEHTTGVGDSTTDVTSIVIVPGSGNLAGTGDRYVFMRCRAFGR